MYTRAELKQRGKAAFKRNYWAAVAAAFLAVLFQIDIKMIGNLTRETSGDAHVSMGLKGGISSTVTSVSAIGLTTIILIILIFAILKIIIGNLLELGGCRFFLENRVGESSVSSVFYFFKEGRYMNGFVTLLLRNIYIYLWTLLLIIPGIIKEYEYAMIPYILAENPDLDRGRVFDLSKEMMRGHKWELFVLQLSFILWDIFAVVTLALGGIFFVTPYIQATTAEFYAERRREAFEKGYTGSSELPGFEEKKDYYGMPEI